MIGQFEVITLWRRDARTATTRDRPKVPLWNIDILSKAAHLFDDYDDS